MGFTETQLFRGVQKLMARRRQSWALKSLESFGQAGLKDLLFADRFAYAFSATLLTLFVLPTLYARLGGWRPAEDADTTTTGAMPEGAA